MKLKYKQLALILLSSLFLGCAASAITQSTITQRVAEGEDQYFANILANANRGDKDAQERVSNMYRYGLGVSVDLGEAERWCRQASGRVTCNITSVPNEVEVLASQIGVQSWLLLDDPELLREILINYSSLKDPFSSQFRRTYSIIVASMGVTIWCGQVNAKNSNGAYTGWSRFYAILSSNSVPQSLDIEPQNSEAGDFADIFNVLCESVPQF